MRTLSLQRVLTSCVLGTGIIASVTSARAALPDCTNTHADWVKLSVLASAQRDWAERLRSHLSAELARHQIAVCSDIPGSTQAPLAIVRVVQSESHKFGIEVRVEDQVTDKMVARQLDLTRMPEDSHAMTVALGVSELLRASWAELNLVPLRAKAAAVPPGVKHALDEATRTPTATMGIELAAEEFTGGLRQGGVDVLFDVAVTERLQLGLRLGGREGLSVRAPDGTVDARSWLAGFAPQFRLTPTDATAALLVTGHLDAARVQFSADAASGAVSASGSGTACNAGLGVRASLKLSAASEFSLEASAGDVLKSVRARDGGRDVVAWGGGWVGAAVGVNVGF